MKHLFGVLLLLIVQGLEAVDRWLCRELPWPLRLRWHSLWVRNNPFHESLLYDHRALLSQKKFRRKLLRVWMDISRTKPRELATTKELAEEGRRIVNLENLLKKNYEDDLERRRDIAKIKSNDY